jgi:hypothetical protein
MANTLTNLTPDLFEALDVVSREQVGMIPAVSRDSNAERAAKDQTVRSFVAPTSSADNVSPGQLPADNGDQTIANKTITISKSRYVPIRWNGEEQRGMNTGPGYNPILRDQFAQAMRTLCNEIELDLCGLYVKASRAVAPAGTTLFDATGGLKDIANARRILVDNGAPMNDVSLVLNSLAGASLRGLNQFAGANTAGSDSIVRQGILLDVYGVHIRESAQIYTHVNGTADGDTNLGSTDYAIGATTLALAAGGTGTFKKGDVVSFDNSDSNLYVVANDVANVATGNLIIGAPGLRKAITADSVDVDINASLDRNMIFSRNAIHLVTRAPARPVEGDSADDVMIVVDPRSGLAFEVAVYREYRQVKYEVAIAWGYEMIKPEHCALLID